MSIFWLAPAALFGILLVAVPIAIHLLVRQQGRRVDYPSLRFVQPSALAAFRRRTIQDALLLACRAAIIAAAAVALAGPVWQTASRTTAQGGRVARAVVLIPGTAPEAAAQAGGDAFVSRPFSRAHPVDAIADAVRWLDEQPPSSREIVVAGTLRRGSLSAGDLAAIPITTGVRFAPVATAAPRDVLLPVLRSTAGGLLFEQQSVHLSDDQTRVSSGASTPAPPDAVRVVAAPADQALADAALRAALAAGLRWSRADQRVLVVWQGADDAAVRQQSSGASLIQMERPMAASTAASAMVSAIENVTATSMDSLEPARISDEQLHAWSRPPGGVPAGARPADEGDRRWLWGLVIALLALEHVLRRAAASGAVIATGVEARVA
jgi:hypothetical protein